jgi:hypothetical protein
VLGDFPGSGRCRKQAEQNWYCTGKGAVTKQFADSR